jgi:uncharacterized protein (TIGR02996 family)
VTTDSTDECVGHRIVVEQISLLCDARAMADPVQQVLASRKAHGLRLADAADYGTFPKTLPPVATAMGFADHASYLSVLIDAGNALTRGAGGKRPFAMLAFLDGYAFAKHLHGAPVGKGKALAAKAALTRFLRASARSGPALLASPHADTARALIESLGPDDDAAREVMANAFACGVLLFQYEHGVALAGFEALSTAAPKKQKASRTAVKHVAALPKHLLAGVLAAPHDDAPRLVLADWLTEQGDPRGEFIQVQCALGRALFGAEGKWVLGGRKALPFETREQLEAREQELLQAYEKQWIAPIRKVVRQWGFKRGFVNHVIADVATFAAATDGALAETPLESARLTGFKPGQLGPLARAAPHATLETLHLGMNRLDDRAAALLGAPLLSKVTALNLEGNPLGQKCLEALASQPSLRRLMMHGSDFDDVAFAALAKARWWRSLTGLSLGRCPALTSRVVETLAAAPELDWLTLDVAGLTDADVLAVAKAHPKLKQFSFVRAQVSERTVEAVIDALPQLAFLDVPYQLAEAMRERLTARFGGATYARLM